MRTKENYRELDAFRLAAALLVVAIHTSPLLVFSETADFFLTRVLARVAVPFFFMVTGQFVTGKSMDSGKKDRSLPRRYLLKISTLYLFSILLYLPIGLYAGHYRDLTPGRALKLLLFDGTFYHLWYFPACVTGVLIVSLLGRFFHLRGMLTVSVLTYLAGLFGDSYYGLARQIPLLTDFYDFLFRFSSYTRNGIFFAPLFLTLGACMRRPPEESSGDDPVPAGRRILYPAAGLFVSFALMTAEAFCLRRFGLQRHDSMYLFLPAVMFFLYKTLLSLSALSSGADNGRKRRGLLRDVSLLLYLLHPAFIVVLRGAAKALNLTALLVDNSLIHYFAVTALSLGTAFCLAFIRERLQADPLFRPGSPGGDPPQKPLKPSCKRPLNQVCQESLTQDLQGLSEQACGDLPSPTGRAWIELDRRALSQNLSLLRSLLPEGCRLMPAVKANAYGHGAALIAGELNRLGVDAFSTACLAEGIALREAGIRGEILLLGYTAPGDFPLLSRYDLTQTVIDYPFALQLSRSGIRLRVHVGIDTGMHRFGIRSENEAEILSVFRMPNLTIDGMFTHLGACDLTTEEGRAFTHSQIQAFYRVAQTLEEHGIPRPRLHLQSSYGLLNYPCPNADCARPGILLYGVHSTAKDAADCAKVLSPVLSLKARVTSVRSLRPGESAGYGLAFIAEKPMRIAVLSIGYADGLPRALSCGRGFVLLHGKKAPILGKVCMDLTLADVSEIPRTAPGDVATLIGQDGGLKITAEELSGLCGTISNELLSRLGPRLERFFVETH